MCAADPAFENHPAAKLAGLIAAIVIGVVTFVSFVDVLDFEFLNYDDDTYVTANPVVHLLTPRSVARMFGTAYYRSYQPLTLLSHSIDYAIWGESPRGHHLSNLILHSLNAVMVFALSLLVLAARAGPSGKGFALMAGRPGSFAWQRVMACAAAALFFGLHPLRVESVAWISDRKDLLVTFFLLPSAGAYLLYRSSPEGRSQRKWYVTSVVLFAFALLTKSVAVFAPFVLFSLDLLASPYRLWRRELPGLVRNKIPFFGLSLIVGVVAIVAATGHSMSRVVTALEPIQKVMVPFYTIGTYLVKTVVPYGVTPIHLPPAPAYMALIVAAVLLGAGFSIVEAAKSERTGWLLGGWAYTVLVMPTLIGVAAQTGMQPWADRFSYLPAVALAVLSAGLVESGLRCLTRRGKRVIFWGAVVVTAVVIAHLDSQSRQHLQKWRDSETLWRFVMGETPGLHWPYNNMGAVFAARGDYRTAIGYYNRAVALDSAYASGYYNLGLAYTAIGGVDSAIMYYHRALAADSTYAEACTGLGNLMVSEGRASEALAYYQRALLLNPETAKPYHNIGIIYFARGDRPEALSYFKRAVELDPFSSRGYLSLGVAYSEEGMEQQSMDAFRQAARLGSVQAREVLATRGVPW